MAAVNPALFKKYDIRGRAEGEDAPLTQEAAWNIGRAFGTYLQPFENKETVVVGRDNRRTSYDLQAALIEGLRKSGCSVYNIGLVGTPLVYWHAVKRGDIGGVMVTGSHLTSDQNGFKLCIGNRTLYGDDIQAVKAIIETREFFHGDGDLTTDDAAYSHYVRDLGSRVPRSSPLNVVVDAGNGVGGLFAPRLIELWGHRLLKCLFCEPDGSYPNHQPNPQEEANLLELGAWVRELGADIGLAFDGDADRVGVVDERGKMVAADRILALLARDMLSRHPGADVVADALTSQTLFDVVRDAGGKGHLAPSGHSLVKDAMREINALLGGEMSGHIFLGEDYFGFDDGFMAAGRIMQLLASTDKTLSELDAELPRYFSTPEYRPHCDDDLKARVIDGVADALKDAGEISRVDGVRVQFDKGWGILRASNTEPVLSLRFEGETEADAIAYRQQFVDALAAFPQVGPLE